MLNSNYSGYLFLYVLLHSILLLYMMSNAFVLGGGSDREVQERTAGEAIQVLHGHTDG